MILDNKPWREEFRLEVQTKMEKQFPYNHELKLGASSQLAARRLYEEFRQLGEVQGGLIYVIRSRENTGPDWEAVWDRIERAASFTF